MDRLSKLKKRARGNRPARPKQVPSSSSEITEVNAAPDVFMPGDPMEEDEELVYDASAYHMLHAASTTSPCLSFDVIPDDLGNNRETYPHTAYIVAGTQAERQNGNSIIVMKVSNMLKTLKEDNSESESDEDSEEEDEEAVKAKLPRMETSLVKHHGCINRVRCKPFGEAMLAAAWSEMGKVSIVDLNPQLRFLNDPVAYPELKKFQQGVGAPIQPLFVFNGHQIEGYSVDWSPTMPGALATGDTRKNIHVWTPTEGSWHVNQMPLVGHSASVEDLHWSPNEPNVLASCSVDKSIRIWDTRESGTKSCKLVLENAHASDVNVISWNKKEPLIISGGDDGFLYVWDLRQFKTGNAVATLKHHNGQVSTVEWSPHDSSVFASGGADDQIALWDLAVEKDCDAANGEEETIKDKDLPPQLLFIHQGQTELKELHWHSQIPGMVISTAASGFNFFKTISV